MIRHLLKDRIDFRRSDQTFIRLEGLDLLYNGLGRIRQKRKMTYIIIIFRLLILKEQFQALLPDLRLTMATSAVALLRFVVLSVCSFLFRVIRLASCLGFAMSPDDRHPRLRVSYVTDFVRKIGIQLRIGICRRRAGKGESFSNDEDMRMKTSVNVSTGNIKHPEDPNPWKR